MLKMRKILGISLVLLFLLSATSAAVSAHEIYGEPISWSTGSPIASFTAVQPHYGDHKITVFDTSYGEKALWKWWSWGDGTGSSYKGTMYSHTYKHPGTYTLTLKETNKAGYSYAYALITVKK